MRKTTHKEAAVESIPLAETCRYCERVPWGNIRYLSRGVWTHEECAPGSQSWCDWYERQPQSERTSAMKVLYQHKRHSTRATN